MSTVWRFYREKIISPWWLNTFLNHKGLYVFVWGWKKIFALCLYNIIACLSLCRSEISKQFLFWFAVLVTEVRFCVGTVLFLCNTVHVLALYSPRSVVEHFLTCNTNVTPLRCKYENTSCKFPQYIFWFHAVYHAQVYCCCLNCAACPIFCFCCDVWISGGMTKRKKPSCCILSLCAASCLPCSGPRAPISLQFFSYYCLGKRFNYTYTVVILLSPDSNGTWTVSCCTCEVFTAEGRSEDGRVRWGKDGNLGPRIRRAPSDMWPPQQA